MASVLTGGPLREFIWGGITLRPVKDAEPEVELDGTDFTGEKSPNGDVYSTGEEKIGTISQECAMTTAEYAAFMALKDGTSRSGTATYMNGDVLSLNCLINEEHKLSSGKITVSLAGGVSLQ